MITTENTTLRKPSRKKLTSILPKGSMPESRKRSHHSEQAIYRKAATQLPETEPMPPITTISSSS